MDDKFRLKNVVGFEFEIPEDGMVDSWSEAISDPTFTVEFDSLFVQEITAVVSPAIFRELET